jgi:hypothetical protein
VFPWFSDDDLTALKSYVLSQREKVLNQPLRSK